MIPNKFKIYVRIFLILIILFYIIISSYSFYKNKQYKNNINRLENNQSSLILSLNKYKLKDSSSVLEIQTLTLNRNEFKNLYKDKVLELNKLNLKLKNLQSYSSQNMQSNYIIKDTIKDSIIINNNIIDTLKCLNINNNYIKINGCIINNKFEGVINTSDTLIQIVTKVPKKFLWFTYGVKYFKQTIHSTNPYSNINYSEFIEINN